MDCYAACAVATLVVVIPGNPGNAAFYDDFVARLRAQGHEVLITGHPVWCTPQPGLRGYAEHQAEAVRRHLAATGRAAPEVEIVLVGHSVGAYLAHRIVAEQLLPVARVFMLFPFLRAPAPSGAVILAGLSVPPLFRAALAAVRALPASTRRRLIDLAGAGEQAALVQAALLSDEAIACAVMASAERAEIGTRKSAAYLFEHELFRTRARFVPMLCARDRWAPPALAAELGPFVYRFAAPVGHSFVVHADQRRAVVEVLHAFLSGRDLRTG